MKVKKIKTDLAPKPLGFYSQAVQAGNFIFISGQLQIVPDSGVIVKGDIEKQAIQVLENIKAILEGAGSSLNNIIKTTIFIRDITQWEAVNKIYAQYLEKGNPHARSVIVQKNVRGTVLLTILTIFFPSLN